MITTFNQALLELQKIAKKMEVPLARNMSKVLDVYFQRHPLLKVGDIFTTFFQTRKPLKFKVKAIDHKKGTVTVECCFGHHLLQDLQEFPYSWEETWEDLAMVELALEIGEYKLIENIHETKIH